MDVYIRRNIRKLRILRAFYFVLKPFQYHLISSKEDSFYSNNNNVTMDGMTIPFLLQPLYCDVYSIGVTGQDLKKRYEVYIDSHLQQ